MQNSGVMETSNGGREFCYTCAKGCETCALSTFLKIVRA